jgi:hypothetical protein
VGQSTIFKKMTYKKETIYSAVAYEDSWSDLP